MAKKKNTADIGFEDKIWKAADVLRGSIDAAEYKNVVLGLIFLKYISDNFEEKHRQLAAEGDGFEEDKDAYTAENVFFVPAEARWEVIAENAHKPEIGTIIDNAMAVIERENSSLKGVLPKNFARPELDKRRLGDVVDIFTNNISLGKDEENKDLLGRTYEYCLAKFAQLEGKNAGEFYTPACVVRTLVAVIEPFKGRVYDPTCGSGGMFVQSADFVKHHQGLINNISIYGQEINANTWKMCKMNLAIRNLEANLGESNADTLMHDNFPTTKMDFGLSNPPFNMSDWGQDKLQDDPRWKYGIPPASNANFAFMEHLIYHMSPRGRVGMVLANGSLSSQTGGEGDIRKNILEDDLVEGIVALPSQLFYSTQIPVCLWFLSRRKEQPGKVLFVDARNMGEMVSRRNRELSEDDINHIAGLFNDYRRGELKDEKGLCAVKSLDDIREQDYILTPGRYVGIAEQEDDGEPFDEKMNRLTTELSGLFTESHRLEKEIQKQLASIGFKLNF